MFTLNHACILPDFRQMLESKQAKFAELASKESDCSSARKGGDLGHFGRGQMQSEPLLVYVCTGTEFGW